MSVRLLGCGFASAMALTVALAAQSAPSQTPAKPTTNDQAHSMNPGMMVTVEGCLRPETAVPGRAVPERLHRPAVADADWVLTDTKMIKGMQPQIDGSTSAVGTSGAKAPSLQYKVKGENLKFGDYSNKRVRIEGMFSHEKRADNQVAFASDLVKLNATTIRDIPGDCPKSEPDKK